MALHGLIQVNGCTIGAWTARRTRELTHADQISIYECGVDWLALGQDALDDRTRSMRFELEHKYSDGAVVLAAKVLTRASQ